MPNPRDIRSSLRNARSQIRPNSRPHAARGNVRSRRVPRQFRSTDGRLRLRVIKRCLLKIQGNAHQRRAVRSRNRPAHASSMSSSSAPAEPANRRCWPARPTRTNSAHSTNVSSKSFNVDSANKSRAHRGLVQSNRAPLREVLRRQTRPAEHRRPAIHDTPSLSRSARRTETRRISAASPEPQCSKAKIATAWARLLARTEARATACARDSRAQAGRVAQSGSQRFAR